MKYSLTTLAAAALLALALPAQAVTINGTASASPATPGGNVVVTLTLDVSADTQLIGLTFNLDWPSSGLSLDLAGSTALGQPWAAFATTFDPDFTILTQSADHLGVSTFLPLTPLSAGTHTLAMSFTALAAGNHSVSYDLSLGDVDGVDHQVKGSTLVNVSAVPEPHPAALLAAGLAVVGLIARRRPA